jgi:hypothetical protein
MAWSASFGDDLFSNTDFEGFQYAITWERFLKAIETFSQDYDQKETTISEKILEAGYIAEDAQSALAAIQDITGGFVSIGSEALDVPINALLGSAAYLNTDVFTNKYGTAISAAYQVVPTDLGKLLYLTTGTVTITLPLIDDVPLGWATTIKNRAGTLTIARNGSNINGAAANLTPGTGVVTNIMKQSATNWETY